MATTDRSSAGEVVEPDEPETPTVSAYSTTSERMVFTESGNGDGWIATDLAVEPLR